MAQLSFTLLLLRHLRSSTPLRPSFLIFIIIIWRFDPTSFPSQLIGVGSDIRWAGLQNGRDLSTAAWRFGCCITKMGNYYFAFYSL